MVLTGADAVAWLSGGVTTPIERGAFSGPLALVVGAGSFVAVTTTVELPRLEAESGLSRLGVPLHAVPWYEPEAIAQLAFELCGGRPARIASDRAGAAGVDCADDLVELRLALGPGEQERLGALARDATTAVEQALAAWTPGERDRDLLARIDASLARDGIFGACLIVGGDERLERFRHPLAIGAPMYRSVMAVLVGEREGLHVALTRFASAGPASPSWRAAVLAARSVEAEMLAASRPGASYGDVLRACAAGYDDIGAAGAWAEHYQGGPIGYRQREFELAPPQSDSRWFAQPLAEGHALAWNPSVSGGGKCEDTYLVTDGGLRRLTDSGRWPLEADMPAILDITTGLAA